MAKETWTVQSRDQNGKLLAETAVLWDSARGAVKTETNRGLSPAEWEAFRQSLGRLIGSKKGRP